MSDFNESRRINYGSDEIYCRYLCIDLPRSLRSRTYTGKFGQELKKIGIVKFPFEITVSDLILRGGLAPSLYVTLPREYFDGWINFPHCPRESDSNNDSLIGMYACHLLPEKAKDLNDMLHPYDGELKSTFRDKFQSNIPNSFDVCNHPGGVQYISAETYLPYWQVYALAGSFHTYRYAECLLSPQEGKVQCLGLIKSAAETFIKKYSEAFDRISWYKTISAGVHFGRIECINGQLHELVKEHSRVTVELLKQDLRLLLELDADWNSIIKINGCVVLENVRNRLSKDIYLTYEQLRLFGIPASSLFEEFSPNCVGGPCTSLHEVLQFEGFGFKKSFVSLGTFYCNQAQAWGYGCTEEVFNALMHVPGFDAWIRAFHDLHESINAPNKQLVSFRQNRVVDALIVMSVRTEIVLREMFRDKIGSKSDEPIGTFLKSLKAEIQSDAANVLDTCCNEIKANTKLNNRPCDLFTNVENIKPSNWAKKDIFFLHALLKFLTARNYFAHHAYKDEDLNGQESVLSREILESLLATLLFFHKHKTELGGSTI